MAMRLISGPPSRPCTGYTAPASVTTILPKNRTGWSAASRSQASARDPSVFIMGEDIAEMGGSMGVNAWLIKGFFDTIPMEIDESAKVDGATHGQVFWGIILPLATPVLAVVGYAQSFADGVHTSIPAPGLGAPPGTVASRLRLARAAFHDAAQRMRAGGTVDERVRKIVAGRQRLPAAWTIGVPVMVIWTTQPAAFGVSLIFSLMG